MVCWRVELKTILLRAVELVTWGFLVGMALASIRAFGDGIIHGWWDRSSYLTCGSVAAIVSGCMAGCVVCDVVLPFFGRTRQLVLSSILIAFSILIATLGRFELNGSASILIMSFVMLTGAIVNVFAGAVSTILRWATGTAFSGGLLLLVCASIGKFGADEVCLLVPVALLATCSSPPRFLESGYVSALHSGDGASSLSKS